MSSASNVQPCSLQCKNGGICKIGSPQFGYAADMDENDPQSYADHVSSSDNQYCECPDGYAGQQCEISFVICEGDQLTCKNGSPCVVAQSDTGGTYRHCECDGARSDLNTIYGLHFCRSAGMVYCSENKLVGNSFCANGGSCKEMLTSYSEHKGCECTSGWEGNRCQFWKSKKIPLNTSKTPKSEDSSLVEEKGLIIGVAAACVVVIFSLLTIVIWNITRRKANGNQNIEMRDSSLLKRKGNTSGLKSTTTEATMV